jgi:hypothetical protein
MDEAKVLREFHTYKKQIINILGKDALVGNKIQDTGNKLFGSKFRGVFAQNEKSLDISKTGYYIINTDILGKPGTHWVALYITPKTVYIFDSFGRKSHNLLPHLVSKAHKQNKKIIDTDHDRDQSDTSNICGQLCLAWLMVVKSMGIRGALLV